MQDKNPRALYDCKFDPSQKTPRIGYDWKCDVFSCPAAMPRCGIREVDQGSRAERRLTRHEL